MVTDRIKQEWLNQKRKLNLKIVGFRPIKELPDEISQLAKDEEDAVTEQRGQSGQVR
jgi:hypothetical protein